jgi:hypothetical protein
MVTDASAVAWKPSLKALRPCRAMRQRLIAIQAVDALLDIRSLT